LWVGGAGIEKYPVEKVFILIATNFISEFELWNFVWNVARA